MKITILTLFPEMFQSVFDHSILKRAQEKNVVSIDYVNIRDFGIGKHQLVDDTPYGGGVGMVMRVDVIASAIAKAKIKNKKSKMRERVILLDPQGETFSQKKAKTLSSYDHLIFICGRYEGVDERVRTLVDEEISIGDYVLTGGEIPVMVIADSVIRLLPHALGKDESSQKESFQEIEQDGEKHIVLEHPHYTKPQEFQGVSIPAILLSGDHEKIEEWRNNQAMEKTKTKRPDLLTTK